MIWGEQPSSDAYLHWTQEPRAEDELQKEEEQEKGRHQDPRCFPCPLPFPFESALMEASGGAARSQRLMPMSATRRPGPPLCSRLADCRLWLAVPPAT